MSRLGCRDLAQAMSSTVGTQSAGTDNSFTGSADLLAKPEKSFWIRRDELVSAGFTAASACSDTSTNSASFSIRRRARPS